MNTERSALTPNLNLKHRKITIMNRIKSKKHGNQLPPRERKMILEEL